MLPDTTPSIFTTCAHHRQYLLSVRTSDLIVLYQRAVSRQEVGDAQFTFPSKGFRIVLAIVPHTFTHVATPQSSQRPHTFAGRA